MKDEDRYPIELFKITRELIEYNRRSCTNCGWRSSPKCLSNYSICWISEDAAKELEAEQRIIDKGW